MPAMGLVIGAFTLLGAPAPALDPALEAEAKRLVQKVWDTSLRTCGRSAFESLDGRVLIELDEPQYHLAPVKLTDAAKESGYTYQTTAVASARRWRWAHQSGGVPRWTPWKEGQDIDVRLDEFGIAREHTLVQDGVLQFDLVQKDGAWKANRPISPLNNEIKPFDLQAAAASSTVPPCTRLTASR